MKNVYLFLSYFITISLYSQVLTQGPLNPGTVVNSNCSFAFGGINFTAPANSIISDNVYTTAMHCECCDQNTQCLTATNFGFSIPGTATINGIIVEIERRSSLNGHIYDNGLRLLKGGIEVGSNYASATQWPTMMDTYAVYGGCADLWGTTWTPADINASNFGLVFACIDYCPFMGVGTAQSFIDHVRITVCYTNSLPIQLEYFDLKQHQNKNIISWKINSDNDITEYQLEKVRDNITKLIFYTFANSTTSVYNYTDYVEQEGETIYRLYGINKDGIKHLITQKSIFNTLDNEQKIRAYTVNGSIKTQIYTDRPIKTLLYVVDICGRILLKYPANLTEGWNYIDFSVPNISSGFYSIGNANIGFAKCVVQ